MHSPPVKPAAMSVQEQLYGLEVRVTSLEWNLQAKVLEITQLIEDAIKSRSVTSDIGRSAVTSDATALPVPSSASDSASEGSRRLRPRGHVAPSADSASENGFLHGEGKDHEQSIATDAARLYNTPSASIGLPTDSISGETCFPGSDHHSSEQRTSDRATTQAEGEMFNGSTQIERQRQGADEEYLPRKRGRPKKGSVVQKLVRRSAGFGARARKPIVKKPRPTGDYTCAHCNNYYTRKIYIKRHIEGVHLFKGSVSCHICGITLKSGGLDSHIQCVHKKVRRFKCPQCDSSFGQSSTLSSHVQSVHLKAIKLVCTICGKIYTSKKGLDKHIFSAHEEHKQQVRCDLCNRVFKHKDHLRQHRRRIHDKIRKHQCDVCGCRFFAKHDLKDHKSSTHEGRRPPKCVFCGKACNRWTSYNKHMKRVHKVDEPVAENLEILKLEGAFLTAVDSIVKFENAGGGSGASELTDSMGVLERPTGVPDTGETNSSISLSGSVLRIPGIGGLGFPLSNSVAERSTSVTSAGLTYESDVKGSYDVMKAKSSRLFLDASAPRPASLASTTASIQPPAASSLTAAPLPQPTAVSQAGAASSTVTVVDPRTFLPQQTVVQQ